MFERILIANRGEIACRIIRTARALGISTVAVYSEADSRALHVELADAAVCIGPAPVSESYLRSDAILRAARDQEADAIHPGYGFLSENADFAESCAKAGIKFIGPSATAIRTMGLKDGAKRQMQTAGVPVVPGYHQDDDSDEAIFRAAEEIGYPVLIKAVAGGGGKGMRRVDRIEDLKGALDSARRESQTAFGNSRVLVEKYIELPRHIELQVFADRHGNAVHLFERDCSLQRRHQKVLEEAPAPDMPAALREAMGDAATKAALAIDYEGAGTVEFLVDAAEGLEEAPFYFMEMNTRLQVEHPVSEEITGLDLVEWQLRVAAGEPLPATQGDIEASGHAMEVRLYAEDPARDDLPQSGRLTFLRLPTGEPGVRVESGVRQDDEVTIHYDPMIAKIIAHGVDRDQARRRLAGALARTRVAGLTTNLPLLTSILQHASFVNGEVDTGLLQRESLVLRARARAQPDPHTFALAAAGLLERQITEAWPEPSEDPCSPWAQRDGFRINEPPHQRLTLQIGNNTPTTFQALRAGPRRWELRCENEGAHTTTLERVHLRGAQISGSITGTEFRCEVLLDTASPPSDRKRFWLMNESGSWCLDVGEELREDAGEATREDALRAPMPGKVLQVDVAVGDRVQRGARLLVLEAMKMEHSLQASFDGTVEELRVSAGSQVNEGVVLLKLNPTSGGMAEPRDKPA